MKVQKGRGGRKARGRGEREERGGRKNEARFVGYAVIQITIQEPCKNCRLDC